MKAKDIASMVRPDLQTLQPYEPHDYPGLIKLDANENPYEFPAEVLQLLKEKLNPVELPRYPDPLARTLREALATYTGARPEQILVGNGSDELIEVILLTFGGLGKVSVIPSPTFAMYKIHSMIAGIKPVEVPLQPDYSLPLDEVKKLAGDGQTVVTFLCTPNNPTGNTIPRAQIVEVLEAANSMVIVDEAYYEFCGETVVDLVDKYPNLVVLRTFSKAFALAGLRVGYMVASKAVIKELLKVKQPYNLNAFSQKAAETVLANREKFEKIIEQLIADRDIVWQELNEIPGVTAYSTRSNFILFHTARPAREVHEKLLQGGVLIRYMGDGPGLAGCLRANIGKKEENRAFLEKLKDILGDTP